MPGEPSAFLHAAHEVRETFAALRWASWLAIGLGLGVVALAWGRVLTWIRSPESTAPRVRRWGVYGGQMYFELSAKEAESWSAAGPDNESVDLARGEDGLLWAPAVDWKPVALISSGGARLPL